MADHLTLSNSRGATRRPSSVFNEAGVGVLSRSPFLFFGFSVIDPARMGKPWPDSQHALASFARRATMDWKGRMIGPRELAGVYCGFVRQIPKSSFLCSLRRPVGITHGG